MSSCISGISKVDFFYSKIDMESKSNSFHDHHHEKIVEKNYKQEQQEEELEIVVEDQEHEHEHDGDDHHDDVEENNEILKRRISTHPLYELLVETHLDCLKVGDISNLQRELKKEKKQAMKKQNLDMLRKSELDLFMEAYCLALSKLKEAMEEPQQKSMAFINNMHSQLRELTMATTSEPDDEAAATTSSSDCAHSEDTITFRG